MGFLDHSTNNIIIDAVLTDTGRAFLARNDGSFSIKKFALGDDEIDYTIIQKFGRTVGVEKVEKNTPIFEAQTSGNLALKHRCVSVSNPNLLRLPTLVLSGDIETGVVVMSIASSDASSKEVTVKQNIQNESSIDRELQDQAFIVKLPSRFLQCSGWTPDNVDRDAIATYILPRTGGATTKGGAKLTLTLETKSITNAQFDIYGKADDPSTISSVVTITGVQSGAVAQFEVQISKTAS